MTGLIFALSGKSAKTCPALSEKIFCFYWRPNQRRDGRIPHPQEGRFAIVTNVECGMRWTRMRY
jgi:hypothetical protein